MLMGGAIILTTPTLLFAVLIKMSLSTHVMLSYLLWCTDNRGSTDEK